jgi:hypothetical protein
MTAELHADDRPAPASDGTDSALEFEPLQRARPNVSGDLPTVLDAAPMFRRALVGYDRFQVDTYVRWAEDELATADREREDLVAHQVRTHAALEDARELLSHSPEGGDVLRMSRRIGTMLAAAVDDAEAIRAEAEAVRAGTEADRATASARARRLVAKAERVLADARAEAARIVAEAVTEVERARAEAGRIVDEAEQTRGRARTQAAASRRKALATEQHAVEQAGRIRQQALDEVSAGRLRAREEIVQMLTTGREARRRADAEAAAAREARDREAAARRASLLVEVADLEHRRAVLSADPDRTAEPTATHPGAIRHRVRARLDRLRERLESHVTT